MLATEKNQRTTARPWTTPLKPCFKIGIFFIDFLNCNLIRGKISIKPNKYLKKAACVGGKSLLKNLTLTITATKQSPVKSIKKILLR